MTQNRDHLDLATLYAGDDAGPFPEYWDRCRPARRISYDR